jgi:hypothetical protein
MGHKALQTALEMVELVRAKKLDSMLECEPVEDEFEFNGSAQLYFNSVLAFVHPVKDGLAFDFVPPPDDKDLVPEGSLPSFTVPRDFNAVQVAKRLRALSQDVLKKYEEFGVTAHIYEDEFDSDQFIALDKDGNIVGDASDFSDEAIARMLEDIEADEEE